MDIKKTILTVLAASALTTAIGVLLIPYRDSSKRKKIADKGNLKADEAKEAQSENSSNVKKQIKTMDEEVNRMMNEGGSNFK